MVWAAALFTACGSDGGTSTETGGGSTTSSSSTTGGGDTSSSSQGTSSPATTSDETSTSTSTSDSSTSSPTTTGDESAPDWVSEVPAGGGWFELTASEPFEQWAAANLEPATGYFGSAPIGAVRDAYCNPIFDHAGKAFYMFGGGHFDGSINAVFKLDAKTLQYSIAVPPTPPSAYPPAYTAPNSAIVYPSGASNGFFQSAETLMDPADTPFAAPFAAPQSSHTYSAMSFVDGKLVLHYGPVRDADVVSGTWTYLDKDTYGPQLVQFDPNYGEAVLQSGTHTANDPETGKAWTTLVSGDAGLNWRTRVLVIEPATHTIEEVVNAPWDVNGSSSIVVGGSHVYLFTPTVADDMATSTRGWRIDKATLAVEHLTLTGDLPSWPDGAPTQESVVVFFDGTRLNFWNYSVDADSDAFFRLDLEPASGSGTQEDPYVLTAERDQRPVSTMPAPALTYDLTYIDDWGVVLFLPKANAKLWAIKL
ncbi:hypothetical protein OV090_03530 [Nannocystis sp. RBIL2]|uniref:hypothetical protein n=1 Tax=Nannocystis sp. RBIL2 TaxID=2996788 RepID=UPI00226E3C59|nr:hypothetical protein [Nannocystis sp. RBIL2]MCY1063816.1 hypothetical protein [Nannocystis sp. RBIL2]